MSASVGRVDRVSRAAGAVVLCALLIVGCADAESRFNTVGSKINADGGASESAATVTRTSAAGGGAGGPRRPTGPEVGSQAPAARDVIYTGSLRVRVGDAVKAADKAREIAERAGGYLAKQDAQLDGDRQVTLSLRVPADEFEATTSAVAHLGKVQGRKVDSQDVTDQVVDIEGRLQNARTSAARLRELLAKAENVQNVVTIEDRLTQRETEIEGLAGSLEVLKDQVELATVRITFTEKDDPTVTKDLPGPLDALRNGGVAFVNVVLVLFVALAYGLPFLVTLAVALWAYRRWRKAHPKPVRAVPTGYRPPPPDAAPAGASADAAPAPSPSPPPSETLD